MASGSVSWYKDFRKNLSVSYKVNHTHTPPLPSYLLTELKLYVYKKAHIRTYSAAHFIKSPNWKQPKYI